MLKILLKPPPEISFPFSLTSLNTAVNMVPPTVVTKGDEEGKSGSKVYDSSSNLRNGHVL